ncbi:catalase family peroxidase [Rheinheimera sp.]|uniref:catalase family peroxidase n=1 Tax=Rheinheimera sp. TaxID=1869214 RepID=UPI00307F528D
MKPLTLAILLVLSPALNAETATPTALIDTFAKLFGEHKGERKGHAKGFCAAGEFTALPAAKQFSQISWLSGATVPVTARFSMAGGNPKAPENSRSPRGMALQLKSPNGELQHFAMLNTPVFGAKDPDVFLGLLQSSLPNPVTGKPDLAKVQAFRQANPSTLPQAEYLQKNSPPWSYATSSYFGIHTFFLTDSSGKEHKVRWHFVPVDGVKGLTDAEIKAPPTDFLQQRLATRLQQGPVHWTMQLVLGEAGDTETDPSQSWPASRTTLDIARLSIQRQGDDACTGINFDPNVLSTGVRASSDPVLQMRSPAYAISFGKRLTGQ